MTDNNRKIIETLACMYPDARPELDFKNEYELLIAAVLSAQCTDKRVNIVTKELFRLFPDARSMAKALPEEIEPYIRTCGLYHAKAKNCVLACRMIVEKFGGKVPDNREELMSLPGVGRKVANVVLSNAFGVPAIAVDTHVFRVANRLGLASAKTPEKTELQLMENIPRDKWSIAHHWLIFHGRRCCSAQNPRCTECALSDMCRYRKSMNT